MPPKRPAPEAAASEVIKKRRVACTWPGCNKDFSTTSGLGQHIRTEHEKITHTCTWPGCNKVFRISSSLNRHVRTEHEKKNDAHACNFDGCQKKYSQAYDLKIHVQRVHENHPPAPKKPRVTCTWPGCDQDFSSSANLRRHIREEHEKKPRGREKEAQAKKRHVCTFDGCQKAYRHLRDLDNHVQRVHGVPSYRKRHACTFDDCQKSYILARDLENHIKTHSGKTFACPVEGCGKKYTYVSGLSGHMKSKHGTPDEIAEYQEKKLEIRQFLADKETRGLCNATKSCPHPPVEGSSRCQTHKRATDLVAKALKERENLGKLLEDSIQNPDEFALLLQRPEIVLDGASKESLRLLSQGLEDVHVSARTFAMDTEWMLARGGHYVPLDITIMRLNGEVIVSTRVDWDMAIKDLEAYSKTRICQQSIRKVYGKSDRTWGKTPEQIIDILQNARILSPDAMI